MKRIILIDGNSLMFRSYYATAYSGSLMQNKNGLYTNAIFGFCNMMNKLLEMEHDYIFVAFDKGKKTFRHLQYDDYKGGRAPMPDEFRVQIPYIKKYLDILNIKRMEVDDYEADDLIASVATLAKSDVDEVLVITGDKDLLQLVDDKTKVCLTRKGVGELEELNVDNFFEKMGINSNQVPDYKGLIGDSSDNLSGIKGIGPKTASKLLLEYGTLENIFDHLDEIKGKTKDLLSEGKETGLRCKYLATLVRDIDLGFGIGELVKKEANNIELVNFYTELEFNSFIQRLDVSKKTELEEVDATILTKDTKFSDNVTINLETFGDNYYLATPLSLSILDGDNFYNIPFSEIQNYPNVISMLKDETVKKNAFDYKKMMVVLNKLGYELNGLDFDLSIAIYLINPSYASEDIAKAVVHLGVNIPSQEEIYGKGAKVQIPSDDVLTSYSYQKLVAINSLKETSLTKIKELDEEYIYNIELELTKVLANMELNGLVIDKEKLIGIGKDLKIKSDELVEKIYLEAGERFNINSVKQLGEVLFVKLGLPSGKKNKTGYSTASDVLEKLAPFYEIVRDILEYRAVTKLLNTYIDGLLDLVKDGNMLHPLYRQTLTQTGRLSSIEPNIQNMPIRTELGKVIRDIFVSRYDQGLVLSVDYSQIELRILADMAEDESMIAMFESGSDIHRSTAAEIYDVGSDEVTSEMRRNAKAINFGIVYGMSPWGLSEQLGISPAEANTFINKYFYKFSNVKEYLNYSVEYALKHGYSKTKFNRVRYIPELSNSNKAMQEFGKRTAMNAPIQGTAADIIKIAMVNVAKKMSGMKSIMIAQVHDELVFDVYPSEAEALTNLVVDEMQKAVNLRVKLIAKPSIGKSWLKD